jgi:hypothetical protein
VKKIYQNFDGLDITFQGSFPKEVLEQLSQAKERAQVDIEKVSAKLGEKQISVLVDPCGIPRFSFVFSTGFDGDRWFVSNSSKSDGWNIRVSVSSAGLAMHGYWAVKGRIIQFLKDVNATGLAQIDLETGKTVSFPKEKISRFDYCFDFWTLDDFKIDPECIVAHSRSSRNFYGEDSKIDFHVGAKGKVLNSFRIGTMPNRQVGLYNKSEEIKSSSKSYWKDIWLHSLKEQSLRDVDLNQGTIWRVEVRAGKDELDKWNLRSFSDLENMTPDIVVSTLKAIRYVIPNQDSNSARWPIAGFWREVTCPP